MTHTTCPTCHASFPVLPPERVVAYLEGKGWRRLRGIWDMSRPWVQPIVEVWARVDWTESDLPEIEVPKSETARDYPRRFRELLTDLARIESRPIADIVEEMSK